MSEARAETRRGALGWVRRLDDAVFAIEQAIVAVALLIITVVIFIDVVARRANAPDSKVGQLIARIAGIEDYAAREALDANVAPYVTVGFSFVLLFFGAYTARRFIRRRKAAKGETVPKPKIAVEAGISAAIAVAPRSSSRSKAGPALPAVPSTAPSATCTSASSRFPSLRVWSRVGKLAAETPGASASTNPSASSPGSSPVRNATTNSLAAVGSLTKRFEPESRQPLPSR